MTQRTLYDAKCSKCGQATSVPFKPDPNKPVYCRTCYVSRPNRPVSSQAPIRTGKVDLSQAWARRR